jgi:hypothetical protein
MLLFFKRLKHTIHAVSKIISFIFVAYFLTNKLDRLAMSVYGPPKLSIN